MKKAVIFLCLVAICAVAGLVLRNRLSSLPDNGPADVTVDREAATNEADKALVETGKKDRKRKPAKVEPVRVVREKPSWDDDEDEDLSAAEREVVKEIRLALDADSFKRVAAAVPRAAASQNPEVRSRMVGALQWFGKRAMPELASFILDRDDDVRGEALDAWLEALQEFESPTDKRDTMLATMKLINDPDAAEAMLAEIADMPNSYQIDILVELIQNGNSVVANAAKEQYEFLTDEEWSSPSAAESWLQENPDDEIEVEDVIEKDAAEGIKTPVVQSAN